MWNEAVAEKSWKVLFELRKKHSFVLMGGWAVYLYSEALRSVDIDIAVDFGALGALRTELNLKKNERLRKYEGLFEGISIDIYLPYYSQFAVPLEDVIESAVPLEGFTVPLCEDLLILKQEAQIERGGSVKGLKDRVDILSLLHSGKVDLEGYLKRLRQYHLESYLRDLRGVVSRSREEYGYLFKNPRSAKLFRTKMLERLRGLEREYSL